METTLEISKSQSGGIYMLYNLNSHRVYIGKTHNFNHRSTTHKLNLKKNAHTNKDLQQDFNKGDNFAFVILEDMGADFTDEQIRIKEKLYMYAFLDNYIKLYNKESREQLYQGLFGDVVRPQVQQIKRALRQSFGSNLSSLQYCSSDTLEWKFDKNNSAIVGA